jgi:hypothetical protein
VASEDAWEAGTFAGCRCSEELNSVGLGMTPRWLRAAAARVMRARRRPSRRARAGWRRGQMSLRYTLWASGLPRIISKSLQHNDFH